MIFKFHNKINLTYCFIIKLKDKVIIDSNHNLCKRSLYDEAMRAATAVSYRHKRK